MRKHVKRLLTVVLTAILLFGAQRFLFTQTAEADTKKISEQQVKTKLDEFYKKYPNNTKWTGSFAGGKQCYGFAKMVIYNIFGKTAKGTYRTWKYDGTGLVGMKKIGGIAKLTKSNVKVLMLLAQPGDVIQFKAHKDNGHQHSMIVWDIHDDGVTVYDCNRVANTVKKQKLTWKDLVDLQGSRRDDLSLLRADNAANYSDTYTSYPTHGTVQVQKETPLNNYACSKSTYSRSVTRYKLLPGEKVEVIRVIQNDQNNCWYEVVYKGETGLYVYSGNVKWLGWDSSDITIKNVSLPSGTIKAGKDVTIKATVVARYNRLSRITGSILTSTGKSAATETTYLKHKSSISIKDTGLKTLNITRLKTCGQYTFCIKVNCEYAYADNNILKCVCSDDYTVVSSGFTVK